VPNRDLKVSIDGDDSGLDAALKKSEESARGLDRELAKLERQQAAEERVAAASAVALKKYAGAEDQAALSARKMGLEVKKAAENAERAQVRATAAAEAAAKGSFDKERAAKLAARADEAVERAAIKAAEAQIFQAEAAKKAADAERKNAEAAKKAAVEAELSTAKERLGWLKSNGMAREHNRLLKDVQARFGELGSAGGAAFHEMETTGSKAFAAIGSTSYGAVAQAVAVISAIPFAALGAEVAVAGGIGAAVAGVGLMATKSDAEVQAALGKMTSHVKAETTRMAAPFKQTWLAIAQEGTKTFDALAPEIGRDFAKIAPVVTNFVHSAGYAATLLGPSFGHATDAAVKLTDALGGKLPEISRSVGKAIDIVSKSAGENADEFANITSAIAGMLPVAAHLLDWAVKAGPYLSPIFGMMAKGAMSADALHDGLSKVTFGLVKTDHSLKMGGGSFQSFAQQSTVAAAKAGQLMTAEQAAALGADQLKAALDSLTGKTLSEREALVGYRQAITAMNQALKDNGHAHGFATAKGAENEAALDKLASSAQSAAEAMKAAGKDPGPFLEQARQRIVSMAEKMHYSADAANVLANKLLGIKPVKLSVDDADFVTKLHKAQGLKLDPKTGLLRGDNSDYFNKWLKAKGLTINPKTGLFRGNNADYYNKWLSANHLKINTKTGKITGNTAPFWSAVHSLPSSVGTRHIDIYAQMHLSAVQAYVNKRSNFNLKARGGIVHRAAGGPVQRMADGGPSGLVVGPGTGTSDSILTAVSNGEYVVRADRTREFRPLLDLINYGRGRSPVAAAPTLSGASGGARPSQVNQTNYFQAQDPHVVARESAREMAWMLRG
jgi:hypothetical protein